MPPSRREGNHTAFWDVCFGLRGGLHSMKMALFVAPLFRDRCSHRRGCCQTKVPRGRESENLCIMLRYLRFISPIPAKRPTRCMTCAYIDIPTAARKLPEGIAPVEQEHGFHRCHLINLPFLFVRRRQAVDLRYLKKSRSRSPRIKDRTPRANADKRGPQTISD